MGNTCGDRKKKTGQNGFREIDVCEYNSSVPENNFKRGCKDVRFDSAELSKYPQNVSATTKYNLVTFLPKSLWFQFKKYTNIYFGLLLIPACFPSIAAYGLDSQLPPFLFILLVALVREGVEDFRRHKSDREFNKSPCKIIRYNKSINTVWRNIVVGDIVVLRNDERIPADMIVLGTSNSDGRCYMETSTLDGEKNLKPREAMKKPSHTVSRLELEGETVKSHVEAHLKLFVPKPSFLLYEFSGYVHFYTAKGSLLEGSDTNGLPQKDMKQPLDSKNLLLKGAKIKNTRWVLGLVAYTGKETKIQLNATTAKFKMTDMEGKLHRIIAAIFLFQVLISIFAAFGRESVSAAGGVDYNYKTYLRFIGNSASTIDSYAGAVGNLVDGLRYFLLLNTLIPISLIVTLEVIRLLQCVLTRFSYDLTSFERGIPCKVNTASVNEELGQIKYILTDKTGTLTQNKMMLQGVFLGDTLFGGRFIRKPDSLVFEAYSEMPKPKPTAPGANPQILDSLAHPEDLFDINLHNIIHSKEKAKLRRQLVIATAKTKSVEIVHVPSKESMLLQAGRTLGLESNKKPKEDGANPQEQ